MLQVPLPPVTRWERYTHAAQRLGIPPRPFLDAIVNDPSVRTQRLGKRALVHVAANDADALAQRMGTR